MVDFRGYYFGSTQKAAKQVAWNYFKKLLAPLSQKGLCVFRETELQVQFSTGAWITLAGSENIEAYRGIYIDRIVADEVASWKNALYAWFEVLRPAMADRMARGMIIGTVKGLDLLYDFYVRGISPEVIHDDWGAVKLPASLTGIIPAKELAELERSMSKEAYERELECNFFAENPEVLITPKEIKAAQNRYKNRIRSEIITVNPYTTGLFARGSRQSNIFGVDIGRTGDPSVVYMRRGMHIERLLTTNLPDNMAVADKISRLIKIHHPATVFIDAGQGQGVIDRLYALGHQDIVVEIYFNAESPEPNCVNLRAAMYYRVKLFLGTPSSTIPDDPQLLRELANQLLADDPNNRVKLAPKKDIRTRIGGSPNDADSVALLFADTSVYDEETYEEQQERTIKRYLQSMHVPVGNELTYNPLNHMENYSHGDSTYDPFDRSTH